MQHPVLHVAVGRAHRVVEPGGHEDAQGGHVARIHVQESKNFGLGIADGVQHGAGLPVATLGQVDHALHAHGPLALVVAVRHAQLAVQLLAHGTHRAVGHHGQGGLHVHARHVARPRRAVLVHALVGHAHAPDRTTVHERFGHRAGGPDLGHARAHQIAAHPLVELADGKNHARMLFQERRDVRQGKGVILHEPGESSLSASLNAPGRRDAPTGSLRYRTFSSTTSWAMGICDRVQVRKAGPDGAALGDHARDAEPDVVGPLVADHLGGHARHGLGLGHGRTVLVHQAARQRGQEAASRRAETDTDDIGLHLGAGRSRHSWNASGKGRGIQKNERGTGAPLSRGYQSTRWDSPEPRGS